MLLVYWLIRLHEPTCFRSLSQLLVNSPSHDNCESDWVFPLIPHQEFVLQNLFVVLSEALISNNPIFPCISEME